MKTILTKLWGMWLVLGSLAVAGILWYLVSWGTDYSAHKACHSLHTQFGVTTTVVSRQCYVKVGHKYRLDKNWTIPERLDYLVKTEK